MTEENQILGRMTNGEFFTLEDIKKDPRNVWARVNLATLTTTGRACHSLAQEMLGTLPEKGHIVDRETYEQSVEKEKAEKGIEFLN